MIKLVEGAERQKTPNEIALNILLVGLTIIFVFATATIPSYAAYAGGAISVVVLVALFVTLIPTTIGALLSAIGIAGMDRLVRFNVLAMSGRAVEAAGDVDTLLLDKTGTITFGNRLATEIIPVPGVTEREAAEAALLASARRRDRGRPLDRHAGAGEIRRAAPGRAAAARSSSSSPPRRGCPASISATRKLRKGAVDSVLKFAREQAGADVAEPPAFRAAVDRIARSGGTPLGARRRRPLLGVIHLKDVVKPDVKERFAELRRMGIKTVMITGDNPVTAAAIASEAGVDDFIAEATPEDKLRYIRDEQAQGPADRHVRRRHQRRAGAGAGRRRRRHADRHAGRARGRQHGRPRLRPDQAHRGGRDRQAAADDARRADHLLDRQRRGEVFRHHPGDVRRRSIRSSACSTSWGCRRRRARSCRRSSSTR